MVKTWEVRAVDDLDGSVLKKASRFLQTFLPGGVAPVWSADHFRWKLGEANPAGRGFMTLAVHDEDVIGTTTITRKRMWDGEKEVAAAEIGDTYSHPDFRREGQADVPYVSDGIRDEYLSRSVFGRLVTETRLRAEAAGISLIYGTPNDASVPGYVTRLGFFDYSSHNNRYYVRPGAGSLTSRLTLLRPMRGLMHAVDRGFARALRAQSSLFRNLEVRLNVASDDDLDGLWLRLRPNTAFGLLRDSAYFRHRFAENPLAQYEIWTVYKSGVICGVYVSRTVTRSDGFRNCFLADWLLDHSVPGIFRFVVSHFIADNYNNDIKTYAFWAEHDWAKAQGLLRLGVVARARLPIIFYDRPESRSLAASHPVLGFTLAASDNI